MRASSMCVAAVLLMAVSVAANAQYTIDYGFNYSAPTLNINYQGAWEDCYAGPFTAYFPGSAPPAYSTFTSSNPFTVYCVDITHNISPPVSEQVTVSPVGNGNNTTITTDPPVSVAQLQESAWLINNANAITQDQLAGLQVAIWGVVGGDTGFTSGYSLANSQSFYIGSDGSNSDYSSILADANSDLIALGGALAAGGGGGNGTLFEISPQDGRVTDSGQNMLGGAPPGTANGDYGPMAPEGSSLYMFAFGVAPLLGAFWLKRRYM